MDFRRFEEHATQAWARIPAAYKAGIDGLLIEQPARGHPSRSDVHTLGECITESYPSEFGGPDTTRSWVVLYYGSFRELAGRDNDFDWAGEIWETLTHELRHHLESLADDDALGDFDIAVDENFKRRDGEPFNAFFYRGGELLGEGLYQVEDEVFQELEYRTPTDAVEIEFDGVRWSVPWPDVDADVAFVELDPVAAPPLLYTLVLVRRASTWEVLKSVWRGRRPCVVQVMGTALRADE